MIEWWGPILLEYYSATEGLASPPATPTSGSAHPGTVGKVVLGELHVLDDDMRPAAKGEPGTLWFEPGSEFSYFNDPDKTRRRSARPTVP